MKVGVLALQGCVTPHVRILNALGVESQLVTSHAHLEKVSRLILPGGESTTMLKFLKWDSLFDALVEFGKTHPMWGICAGSILLSSQVENPQQESLSLIDLKAIRNFYGSQHDSFDAHVTFLPSSMVVEAQFIRAPLLEAISPSARSIATYKDVTVAFQQGHIMASSFHTELLGSTLFHEYFLSLS
jgi:pyridoxal 5'-phosphate synthase pdxT subunit